MALASGASSGRSRERKESVPTGPAGYTLSAQLGRGVFGVVFRGVDPRGKACVVKHMRLTSSTARAEIGALTQLHSHPNLVPILEVKEDAKKPDFVWCALEYCEGPNLNDFIIQSRTDIDTSVKLKIVLDVANALQYLHSRNLLHRNLKPDNVFVDLGRGGGEGGGGGGGGRGGGEGGGRGGGVEGGILRGRVTDYGMAHIWESNVTVPAAYYTNSPRSFGPPFYTAPEVKELTVITEKCDVYSLGMLLLAVILETTMRCTWGDEKDMLVPKIDDEPVEEASTMQIQRVIERKGVHVQTQIAQVLIQMLDTDHERRPSVYVIHALLQDALFTLLTCK